MMQYSTAKNNTVQCSAKVVSDVQSNTVQCSTVQCLEGQSSTRPIDLKDTISAGEEGKSMVHRQFDLFLIYFFCILSIFLRGNNHYYNFHGAGR